MSQAPKAVYPRPPWMTLREAAEYLAVDQKTVRRRIADGDLPAFRVGPRQIRLKASDVEALLQPIPTAGGTR